MQMHFIEDIQKAAADAAAKKQAQNGNGKKKPGGEGAAGGNGDGNGDDNREGAAGGITLSKFFKDKHNIDISDDEALELIKNRSKKDGPPASSGSAAPRKQPVIDEIKDDEVAAYLDAHSPEKSLPLTRYTERTKKQDVEIVKEDFATTLRSMEKFKDADDAEIDRLFNEHYFIAEDGTYSDPEKEWGLQMLKEKADGLRNADKTLIDIAKQSLFKSKLEEYSNQVYQDTVQDFLKTAPTDITIPLGKSGTKELGDYPYKIPDNISGEIAAIMADPKLLAKEFSGDNNQIDLSKFYNFLVTFKLAKNLYTSIASDFHTKGVDEIQSKLGNDPNISGFGNEGNGGNDKAKLRKDAEKFNSEQVRRNTGRRA